MAACILNENFYDVLIIMINISVITVGNVLGVHGGKIVWSLEIVIIWCSDKCIRKSKCVWSYFGRNNWGRKSLEFEN